MPHRDVIYPYKPLQWYPHMGPADADIWNRFVIQNPDRFLRAIYDMRCGEASECDPSAPKNIQDAWQDLCRGRIDVVAEDVADIYVIEVKPRARGEAIGQALNNAHHYAQENATFKRVIPAIVTDVLIPMTKAVADKHGVTIFLVS